MSTKVHVKTTINGEEVEFLCEPRQSLLECLRDIVGLTGSKEGCNDGNCGACTVNLDGRIVDSCLVFGVEVDGKEINTIEGVAYKNEDEVFLGSWKTLYATTPSISDKSFITCS